MEGESVPAEKERFQPKCEAPACPRHNPHTSMRCSKCRNTYYCDIRCQRSDYAVHKKHCRTPGEYMRECDDLEARIRMARHEATAKWLREKQEEAMLATGVTEKDLKALENAQDDVRARFGAGWSVGVEMPIHQPRERV